MLGALKKQALHDQSCQKGFTLIELMIVVAIIGILASVAMGSYQTYTIRAQVTEAISMATSAKAPIVDAYQNNGEAPANRLEAGMSPNADDTQGNYVKEVDIEDGRLRIAFGNNANADLLTSTLYITPYETPQGAVVWRCGNQPQPNGSGGPLAPMGAAGGGNTASYAATTVDDRYLPSTCRP